MKRAGATIQVCVARMRELCVDSTQSSTCGDRSVGHTRTAIVCRTNAHARDLEDPPSTGLCVESTQTSCVARRSGAAVWFPTAQCGSLRRSVVPYGAVWFLRRSVFHGGERGFRVGAFPADDRMCVAAKVADTHILGGSLACDARADGAGDAGATDPAVASGVSCQVLLVVGLGVVELAGFGEL